MARPDLKHTTAKCSDCVINVEYVVLQDAKVQRGPRAQRHAGLFVLSPNKR